MSEQKWDWGKRSGASRGSPSLPQVVFLPTNLGQAEQTFVVVCDNCQVKELVTVGGLQQVLPGGGVEAPAPGAATPHGCPTVCQGA